MNANPAFSSSAIAAQVALPAIDSMQHSSDVAPQQIARQSVSQSRHSHSELQLTEEQREAAIKLAAASEQRHLARYRRTHNHADYSMADRARLSMEALIAGRTNQLKEIA